MMSFSSRGTGFNQSSLYYLIGDRVTSSLNNFSLDIFLIFYGLPIDDSNHTFYRSFSLNAQEADTSRKNGPSEPGRNVEGIIKYLPGGTSFISNTTKPHL